MARCPALNARRITRALVLLAVACTLRPRDAGAQQPVGASPQWEGRLDAVLSPQAGALAGAGVNLRAGWYARVGASLSAGAVQRADTWEARQRADLTARFLFDPFAERRRGFYAGAGIGAERTADGDVRGLLLGVVGMEGAATGRIVPALELQIGGGARLGLVLRERRRQGR
jgi:hypothetical protein